MFWIYVNSRKKVETFLCLVEGIFKIWTNRRIKIPQKNKICVALSLSTFNYQPKMKKIMILFHHTFERRKFAESPKSLKVA